MKTVLFIHGFFARKEDNEYFLNYLRTKKDIDLHTFILPGHYEDHVEKMKYDKWLQKSEEELQNLLTCSKNVILVGHSMGGSIATLLAAKYPEVKKLILIAPAYTVGAFKQNTEDLKKIITHQVDETIGTGFEGIVEKLFKVPPSNLIEVKKLGALAIKQIDQVHCPTLLLHGTLDNIVSLPSSVNYFKQFHCHKTFTMITNVRHQVFKSSKKENIASYIYTYIRGGFPFLFKKKDVL